MNILMVCLGNICRSPIAEGVMKSKLKKNNLTAFVDSAGVLSEHQGEGPDRRAVAVSKKYGVDISDQISRQITASDFSTFDLILTMDSSVQRQIARLTNDSQEKAKVVLFLEYSGSAEQVDVPDPYYGDQKDFEHVFKLIDEACERILLKLEKKNS